ncbi:MAG TPA: carbohydrate kinase family protein, partial [Vicinamibacteria bacterium]|nr:carbohydrate kinase family protein [Vicinamibacteria bacterium]
AWLDARAFHICPMPIEVQRPLVDAIGRRFTSLDPCVILRPDTLEAWRGLLGRADALFLGEDEMELEVEALEDLAGGRLETIVFKRGGRGGMLFDSRQGGGKEPLLHVRPRSLIDPPPYPSPRRGRGPLPRVPRRVLCWEARAGEVVDPTGAGDAFAAGVLAGWLLGEPHERALRRGIVGASFALEGWGPAGLLRATPEAAEARLREWFG